jgi:hypothetical protein
MVSSQLRNPAIGNGPSEGIAGFGGSSPALPLAGLPYLAFVRVAPTSPRCASTIDQRLLQRFLPRWMRLITVPMGTSVISAISL